MLKTIFFSLIFIKLTLSENAKCAINPLWNFDFLNAGDFLANSINAPNNY